MSLQADIQRFKQDFMKDAKHPKKTIITTEKHRKHKYYTQGDTGFVPHPCSDPVNIALAKRGY